MARFRNPFDAPPIRPAPLPGVVDPTGEIGASRDPLADADEAPPDPPGTRLAVEFVGDGAGYTRLWIATTALSLLTLGLYAPWAAVAKRRYLAAHTLIDGVPLVYHGTPVAILRGRAIALALLGAAMLLTFAVPLAQPLLVAAAILASPRFLLSAFAFHARNTSWRGLRFAFDGSRREVFRAVAPLLFWPATTLVTELLARYTELAQSGAVPLLVLLPYVVLTITLARAAVLLAYLRLRGLRYGSVTFDLAISPAQFRRVIYRGGGPFVLKLGFAAAAVNAALLWLGNIDVMLLAQPVLGCLLAAVARGRVLTQRFNLAVHRLTGTGGVQVRSSLTPDRLSRAYFVNALWLVATLGLAAPWRRVATRRLRARQLAIFHVAAAGTISRVAAADPGATGEALADQFDVDLSL